MPSTFQLLYPDLIWNNSEVMQISGGIACIYCLASAVMAPRQLKNPKRKVQQILRFFFESKKWGFNIWIHHLGGWTSRYLREIISSCLDNWRCDFHYNFNSIFYITLISENPEKQLFFCIYFLMSQPLYFLHFGHVSETPQNLYRRFIGDHTFCRGVSFLGF